ncbi:hypothetical protein MN116_008250 [Schistosoma mekongi]|uniref:Protein MIX23 n=1 Tax=Schistosoma mekongi TaxID=38744 RepID=A0AAE1Z6A8_SCHME|nr:hypothetical protein MN116_008250 [Schistosoma mekongi]
MSSQSLPCDDFLQSTKLLNLWRRSDDRVRHELNTELPTVSFQNKVDYSGKCSAFIDKMLRDHEKRTKEITDCIKSTAVKLNALKSSSETSSNVDNKEIAREIRNKQLLVFGCVIYVLYFQLRQFQTELLEEKVIQTSAMKVIYERCREHFRHPIFDKFKQYDL